MSANNQNDNDLDTGLPGFLVGGEVHHYIPGDASALRSEEVLPLASPTDKNGKITEWEEGRDIGRLTRLTLSAYLGRSTQRKNYYEIDSNALDVDEEATSDFLDSNIGSMTSPVVPPIEETRNSNRFTSRDRLAARPENLKRETLGSWKSTTTVPLPEEFVKGKSEGWNEPGKLSGNDITSPAIVSATGRGEFVASPVSSYVNRVLANNRFAASSRPISEPPVIENSQVSDGNYEHAALSQKKLTTKSVDGSSTYGVEYDPSANYDPNGRYNPVLHHPRYGAVTMGRLANIGTVLGLRATGDLGDSNIDPNRGLAEGEAIVPSFNQLGAEMIKTRLLEAKSVLDNLAEAEPKNSQYVDITSETYGVMNNVHDRFSGLSALGQMVAALALSLGLGMVITAAAELVAIGDRSKETGIYGSSDDAENKNVSPRDAYMGSYTGVGPYGDTPEFLDWLKSFIGFQDTQFSYNDALREGVRTFFGFGDAKTFGDAIKGGVKSALLNSLFSSGQTSIVARVITRSIEQLANQAKDYFTTPTINPADSIKGFLMLLESFRSSKLIGALNVFATIGDAKLHEDLRQAEISSTLNPEAAATFYLDNKDRVANEGRQLKWSTRQSLGLHLGDSWNLKGRLKNEDGTFANADDTAVTDIRNDFGGHFPFDEVVGKPKTVVLPFGAVNGRFPTKTRELIEAELDGAYVPFYFHDLRTNEIIAFHAFLTSLSDGFSVSYDSVEGFGRVEPIKSYKGTQRKIGLEFVVAATSPADFDVMWEKVNKLTMLLYPQYTEGRRLKTEGGINFVQPFSQMIGASPVIRLRLGNLLRSNYSRFALAKLFGAGLADTKFVEVDGATIEEAKTTERNQQDKATSDYAKTIAEALHVLDTSLADPAASAPNTKFKGDIGADVRPLEAKLSIQPESKFMIEQTLAIKVINIGPTPGKEKPIKLSIFHSRLEAMRKLSFKLHRKQRVGKVMYVFLRLDEESLIPENTDMSGDFEKFKVDLDKAFMTKYFGKGSVFKYLDVGIPETEFKGAVAVNPNWAAQQVNIKDNAQAEAGNKRDETIKGAKSRLDELSSLHRFMNPNNNALVKSFKVAGGKGLAGVIESMDFTWMDNNTWDVDKKETQAPIYCKVNISFSPIHDISPGLNSQGENRAPIYPVGKYRPMKDDLTALYGDDIIEPTSPTKQQES